MILLQANQIARRFGAGVLFENIHLEISTGAHVALVGRNNAGRSALLKVIAGIEVPDEGKIAKNKTTTLGYLVRDTGLDSNETVWNEILKAFEQVRQMEQRIRGLEIFVSGGTPDTPAYTSYLKEYDRLQRNFSDRNGYGYENEIRSVLYGSKFDSSFYDQKIDTLSDGQRTRLALARMFLQHPGTLILNEPTNYLNIETLSWLESYLQDYTGTLLIVSYDRYFLDKVVSEVYELSRRKMHHYKGNCLRYLDLKAGQLTSEWKAYERQRTEIHKLEDFVARNLIYTSTTERAQSRRRVLGRMERPDRPQGDEKQANFLFSIKKPSENVALQIEDAAIGYDDVTLSEPINLDIRHQEAIALVGLNSIRKSTLLKSIIHQIPFIRDKETLGTDVTISYYDQGQADLHTNETILAELWDKHPTTPEKDIRSALDAFLFSGENVEKPTLLLNGGEEAWIALTRLAMNEESFLILDEPINHLDVGNKEVLESALIDYDSTLLLVSRDRYFINRIVIKVVELSENGSKVYLGSYNYYLEEKQEEEEIAELLAQDEPRSASAPTDKSDYYQSKEQQKLTRSLQRKITQAEEEMTRIDERIDRLEQKMVAPEDLEDHVKLNELNQDLEAARQDQETRLTEWGELSLELGEYEN